MSLIDREALIAEYDRVHIGQPGGARKLMVDAPTVEPERKKGKWIKGVGENGITTSEFCSCCRYENKHWCDWNFCPNCGADMREKQDG